MIIMEVFLTKKAIGNKLQNVYFFNIISGSVMSGILVWIWTLDQTNAQDELFRHLLAKILIVSTFVLLLVEWKLAKDHQYSSAQTSLRMLLIALKLLLLYSGHQF